MDPIMTAQTAETREGRGLQIAKAKRITAKPGGLFLVPSASHDGTYVCETGPSGETCTCKDFEARAERCKHLWATAVSLPRNAWPDSSPDD